MHIGTLLAAVASYLDAKANQGKWLLRIDDIDTPRVDPSAEQSFYDTLSAHGLHWDEPVARQSDHLETYREALNRFEKEGLVFYCTCTRSLLHGSREYPGNCRNVVHPPTEPHTIRVRTTEEVLRFEDCIQGSLAACLKNVAGDFVIFRKDDNPAYPLAVVIDDALAGVTHVVRGSDLIENTFNQIFLSNWLGLPIPIYAHVPVVHERDDVKLSKRNEIVSIDDRFAYQNLVTTLQLLGLDPPRLRDVNELLKWGVNIWDIANVSKARSFSNFMSIGT